MLQEGIKFIPPHFIIYDITPKCSFWYFNVVHRFSFLPFGWREFHVADQTLVFTRCSIKNTLIYFGFFTKIEMWYAIWRMQRLQFFFLSKHAVFPPQKRAGLNIPIPSWSAMHFFRNHNNTFIVRSSKYCSIPESLANEPHSFTGLSVF